MSVQEEADHVHSFELKIAARVEQLVQERLEEQQNLAQLELEQYNANGSNYTSAHRWQAEYQRYC